MMVRVLRPKKSILITPASSITEPSYCVSRSSESFTVATGIISVRSEGAMMIPAACTPVPRTEPSSTIASRRTILSAVPSASRNSRRRFTFSRSSPVKPSLSAREPYPFMGAVSTRLSEIPGLSGTSLAMALDCSSGRSSTRETSFIDILAAIVPYVTMAATCCLPYFCTT